MKSVVLSCRHGRHGRLDDPVVNRFYGRYHRSGLLSPENLGGTFHGLAVVFWREWSHESPRDRQV